MEERKSEMRVEKSKGENEQIAPMKEDKAIGTEQAIFVVETEAPCQNNQLKGEALKGMLYQRLEILKK